MVREEFWDDYEYNFFMELDDEDKLMYLYDLMIGDFKDEYFGNISDFEFEDDDMELRHEVLAVFDAAGWLTITGSSKELLLKVATDMIMNGLVLSNKSISQMEDGDYLLQYKVISKSSPISLN
jgi:hypothetical protein